MKIRTWSQNLLREKLQQKLTSSSEAARARKKSRRGKTRANNSSQLQLQQWVKRERRLETDHRTSRNFFQLEFEWPIWFLSSDDDRAATLINIFSHFSLPQFFSYQYHSNMFAGERAAVPIPPPPETEWYHGRLDRYSAEQRLKTAYKLGSYLGKTKT
jgi:hypothetical protein